jgi:hypothetical protein
VVGASPRLREVTGIDASLGPFGLPDMGTDAATGRGGTGTTAGKEHAGSTSTSPICD